MFFNKTLVKNYFTSAIITKTQLAEFKTIKELSREAIIDFLNKNKKFRKLFLLIKVT